MNEDADNFITFIEEGDPAHVANVLVQNRLLTRDDLAVSLRFDDDLWREYVCMKLGLY